MESRTLSVVELVFTEVRGEVRYTMKYNHVRSNSIGTSCPILLEQCVTVSTACHPYPRTLEKNKEFADVISKTSSFSSVI